MTPGRQGRRAQSDSPKTEADGSGKSHNHPQLRKQIKRLEEELAELRADLQEQRLLGLKVAELADLVTELIGAAARGPEEFDRALAAYTAERR